MLDLTALNDTISQLETVEGSMEALLKTLFDDFEANKNNPAAIQASVDRGRALQAKMAAAVVANTPAAPAP